MIDQNLLDDLIRVSKNTTDDEKIHEFVNIILRHKVRMLNISEQLFAQIFGNCDREYISKIFVRRFNMFETPDIKIKAMSNKRKSGIITKIRVY